MTLCVYIKAIDGKRERGIFAGDRFFGSDIYETYEDNIKIRKLKTKEIIYASAGDETEIQNCIAEIEKDLDELYRKRKSNQKQVIKAAPPRIEKNILTEIRKKQEKGLKKKLDDEEFQKIRDSEEVRREIEDKTRKEIERIKSRPLIYLSNVKNCLEKKLDKLKKYATAGETEFIFGTVYEGSALDLNPKKKDLRYTEWEAIGYPDIATALFQGYQRPNNWLTSPPSLNTAMQYILRTFYLTTASNSCVSLPLDICITNPEHWIKIGEDHPLWAYTIKNVKNHMTLSDDQKLEDLFKEEMIKSE